LPEKDRLLRVRFVKGDVKGIGDEGDGAEAGEGEEFFKNRMFGLGTRGK
jgi:hypothetical protein